ncbi:MAG: hypothetical protein H6741_33010 [Alphaproteobacteria bacterium]|nr:hypothetical protein [Alphaproteobacteria bacterium]
MLRVTVLERGRIERADDLVVGVRPEDCGTPGRRRLPARLFDNLQRAEGAREDRGERAIFNWGRNKAQVGPWVGVLQVPGLQLELLPKTDDREIRDGVEVDQVRANLLHMLELAGLTRVRERGTADVGSWRGMVHDQLAARFVARLLTELRRGADRTYAHEEGNLLAMRGRLILSRQLTVNAAHQHRFYCAYDTLAEDTSINRTLRSACELLRRWALPPVIQRGVAEASALLDGVPPLHDPSDPPQVVFTRQNERLKDLFEFSVLLLSGLAPDVRAGANRTFALLFDMDKVFEGYVAEFLQRYVVPGISGLQLFPQARKHREYLFLPSEQEDGRKALQLAPDLLFRYPGRPDLIIDTKWKRLAPGRGSRPSNSDLYQLYAYLHRYGCKQAYLLYPRVDGVREAGYRAMGPGKDNATGEVGTRFLDLRPNLATAGGRAVLAAELTRIVREGLGLPTMPTVTAESA